MTRYRSGGQFFPLAGRSESIEIDERNAVDHGVANLDHTAESGGRIREGYRPHRRHWQALAGLVGVTLSAAIKRSSGPR